jgi:hypothetical protein
VNAYATSRCLTARPTYGTTRVVPQPNVRTSMEFLGPHSLPRAVRHAQRCRSAALAAAAQSTVFADKAHASFTFLYSLRSTVNILNAHAVRPPP